MIREGTIKRLKVSALADGTLLPNHREGARQPIDDAWWQDVLHDPRAYVPINETSFDANSLTHICASTGSVEIQSRSPALAAMAA